MLGSGWGGFIMMGLLALGGICVAIRVWGPKRSTPPRNPTAEVALPPRIEDRGRSHETFMSPSLGMVLRSQSGWSVAKFYLFLMPVILWLLSLLVMIEAFLSGGIKNSDFGGIALLSLYGAVFPAGVWSFPWCVVGSIAPGPLRFIGFIVGPFINAAVLQQIVARWDAALALRRGESDAAEGSTAFVHVTDDGPHGGPLRLTRLIMIAVLFTVVALAITAPVGLAPFGGLVVVEVTLTMLFIGFGLLLRRSIARQR